MQTLGSPASVVAAIREDCDADAERIQTATAAELEIIRAAASTASVVIAGREQRLAAARRDAEERVAHQEWEGRRAVLEQREQWIQDVVATAQQRWPAASAAALDALVRDARAHLPDGEHEVLVDPGGGCIVKRGDLSFDNTFDARSRRLEPEWRQALGRMYVP
jgi:vacuolar-type H+-ATPase subunit E/Vma4